MSTRRALLTAAVPLALAPLAACSNGAPEANLLREPPLDPQAWFQGRTDAYGVFETLTGHVSFGFRTWLEGAPTPDGFTLRERFSYDTGERWERTWRFVRNGPGRWRAQAENTPAPGDMAAAGNAVRMRYVADMPTGASVQRLGFDMRLHRVGPLVVNRSAVSKWGAPVGRLSMIFVKPGADTGDADAIGALPPFPIPRAR